MTADQHVGLVFALLAGPLALAALLLAAWLRNGRGRPIAESAVRRVGSDLGLDVCPADAFGVGLAATGVVDGVFVHGERSGKWLQVELSSKGIPAGAGIFPGSRGQDEVGVDAGFATGDPDMTGFRLHPNGSAENLACLDATTRGWLRSAQATLSSGQIEFRVALADPDLVGKIRAGIAVARALGAVSVPAALLRNVETDPLRAVRERNEALLLYGYPNSPEAAKRFELRLDSPEATPLQVLEARLMVPSAVEQALARLGADDLRQLLDGPLQAQVLDVACSAAERLEPVLLAALPSVSRGSAIRLVQALGAVGSAACVETLLPYTRATFGGDLDDAATEAVAQIQARLEGAGAGQLSITDDASEGRLSVANQERGAVSLAKKQPT